MTPACYTDLELYLGRVAYFTDLTLNEKHEDSVSLIIIHEDPASCATVVLMSKSSSVVVRGQDQGLSILVPWATGWLTQVVLDNRWAKGHRQGGTLK